MNKTMSPLELKQIGATIRQARKAKGLTQTELGEQIGVKKQAISNYERGVQPPGRSIRLHLSQVLEMPFTDLGIVMREDIDHTAIQTLVKYWLKLPESGRLKALSIIADMASEHVR